MDPAAAENPQLFNPASVQPIKYPDYGGIIDNIFNNAIKYKLANKQAQQIALQNQNMQQQIQGQQAQANLQYAPFGLTQGDVANATPGQIQQAAGPAPQQPQVGSGQGPWANPGGQVDPNAQVPGQQQEEPIVGHIRSFIQNQRAMAQLGIGQQQSDIYKNVGQGAEGMGMLNLTGQTTPQIPGMPQSAPAGNAGQPNQLMNFLANQPPSVASEYMGRSMPMKLGVANAAMQGGINPSQNQMNYDVNVAGKKTTEDSTIQKGARASIALNPAVDKLMAISKQFPRQDDQFMNTPIIKLQTQFGSGPKSVLATRLNYALSEVRMQAAQSMMAGGMPQEQVNAELAKKLPDSITAAQLSGVAPDIKDFANLRASGMLQRATPGTVPPQAITRMGRLPGSLQSVPLVSYDGGKTFQQQ